MIFGKPSFQRTPLGRVLLLGLLVLFLQVPACMIGQITFERQQSRDQATQEVMQTWGAPQQVGGPFLVVPYRIKGKDKDGKPIDVDVGNVVMIPERLDIQARATVETRRRGLYEVPVYRSRLQLKGRFKAPLPELASLVPRESLAWPQAQLVLRLADVRALERVAPLKWGGATRDFQGGGGRLPSGGLHASLAGETGAMPVDFSIELAVRGSDSLFFTPAARETTATLASNWPHPKFAGAWLPDRREVGDQGFDATWSVTSLAGGLPSVWKGPAHDGGPAPMAFGAQMLYPVDPYRMSERTLKYSLLFLGLTFVAVWVFEARGGRAVHPMQYLLLGAALCVFYLLELSLAEHFGFLKAYTVAAAAVTGQVTLYARSIFRRTLPALGLAGVVASLYALLYLLLGAEDYALLIGSGTVFAVLSAVMFFTRRIEWGRLSAAPAPAAGAP